MLNQHSEKLSQDGFKGGQANFYLSLKEKKDQSQAEHTHEKEDNKDLEKKCPRVNYLH